MKNQVMENQLTKVNEILGQNVKLLALRGVPLKIIKEFKKGSEDYYYTFELKVVQPSEQVYNTSYDLFFVIVPSQLAMSFTDADMREFKNSEVLVLLNPTCRLRVFESDSPDENGELRKTKYNQASFYAIEMLKLRSLEVPDTRPPVSYNV